MANELPMDLVKRMILTSTIVGDSSGRFNGGKTRGFEIKEILMVSHGGIHNDTLCMFEEK